MGSPVATILDTKGPEIRIKSFESKTVDEIPPVDSPHGNPKTKYGCVRVVSYYTRVFPRWVG